MIHDELLHLELASGDPCFQQAALSAAMALAWSDLARLPPSQPDQRDQRSSALSEKRTQ
jgi:hypothetical protein